MFQRETTAGVGKEGCVKGREESREGLSAGLNISACDIAALYVMAKTACGRVRVDMGMGMDVLRWCSEGVEEPMYAPWISG